MNQTVIYEITAVVESALIEKYERYMRERHIPDLLDTGHFIGAKIARSGGNRYRIAYEARDQNALEQYLNEHAARLRADFLAHFPDGAELKREVWTVLQIWTAHNEKAS